MISSGMFYVFDVRLIGSRVSWAIWTGILSNWAVCCSDWWVWWYVVSPFCCCFYSSLYVDHLLARWLDSNIFVLDTWNIFVSWDMMMHDIMMWYCACLENLVGSSYSSDCRHPFCSYSVFLAKELATDFLMSRPGAGFYTYIQYKLWW